MLILTIDTTDSYCRVALTDKGGMRSFSQRLPFAQAEFILPMIQQEIKVAPYSKHDITAIATATGPGSFSGIRIGLATARGLGLALNVPVVGYDNFTLWKHTIMEKYAPLPSPLLITLQSKRKDLYVSADGLANNLPPQSAYLDTIIEFIKSQPNELCLAGNMNDEFLSLLPKAVAKKLHPFSCHDFDLRLLSLQAINDIARGKYRIAEPHYVKLPQTSKAKKIWQAKNVI